MTEFDNLETTTPVGRMAERLARREMLRRGGRWLGSLVLVGTFAGRFAGIARAGSALCSDVGCACDNGTCYNNGVTCPPRYGDCQSGGQCWTVAGTTCTNCDWTCSGTPCHCQKCSRGGKPPAGSDQTETTAVTTP